MTAFWATIISAVILGPLVALIQNLKKQNHEEHNMTQIKMDAIGDKIDALGERLTDHIEWHLENPEPNKENE